MLLTGLSIQPQPLSKVLPERERTLREALALVQRGFDDARDAADAILPAMSRSGAALQAGGPSGIAAMLAGLGQVWPLRSRRGAPAGAASKQPETRQGPLADHEVSVVPTGISNGEGATAARSSGNTNPFEEP